MNDRITKISTFIIIIIKTSVYCRWHYAFRVAHCSHFKMMISDMHIWWFYK